MVLLTQWLAPASLYIGVTLVAWGTLLAVLPGVARFTGGAAVPSGSEALTGAGEHVLWVGQWAGTGLAVLRRPGRGISVVASCARLTELTHSVVLTTRAGSSLRVTHFGVAIAFAQLALAKVQSAPSASVAGGTVLAG